MKTCKFALIKVYFFFLNVALSGLSRWIFKKIGISLLVNRLIPSIQSSFTSCLRWLTWDKNASALVNKTSLVNLETRHKGRTHTGLATSMGHLFYPIQVRRTEPTRRILPQPIRSGYSPVGLDWVEFHLNKRFNKMTYWLTHLFILQIKFLLHPPGSATSTVQTFEH